LRSIIFGNLIYGQKITAFRIFCEKHRAAAQQLLWRKSISLRDRGWCEHTAARQVAG